ncbi:oxidation resistance protein 1 [Ophiostoma piceae UAMH 11346]|uniref:Oxidation resistance protein 1 n=1 Tax=Ophiostoma piceae (strain UAMH 11346) TaxID=1262450 RepID=S3CSL3_OPHP1|nr:oxidation resistance protein 1 [Ophiostoma piceae UAMH 11346]
MTRTASPLLLRPPPLEPLTLSGFSPDTPASARLLTSTVAEEIRIMVPERLRIEEDWKLAYSLDQDGASLATLYEKAARYDEHRIGFVLVVKDQDGGIFGAYLTEYPRPSSHYFGTGECFLWRAAVLAPTHYTTSRSPAPTQSSFAGDDLLIPGLDEASTASPSYASSRQASSSTLASMAAASVASTQPPRSPLAQLVASPPHPPPSPSIRFSAFPYSGVNEYFIYCEAHSLSVGGGDGRYGLWLNDSLEKGISATCLTFGNQPLSDEGEKFGVLGVELWVIGSRR